jgi:amino acid adenylation domain-containing protein
MNILQDKLIGIPKEQLRIRNKCFHPSGSFEEFRREDFDQSIVKKFEQQVERFPDRLAVRTLDCELTYRELNQAANRIAHRILELCGKKSEPVAMLFEAGVPFVHASLGILKSGKIQVPLERGFPRARLSYMLEQSSAAIIVTNGANLNLATQLSRLPIINVDKIDQDTPATNPGLLLRPDSQVAINYTSGSTGKPKGIVRTHRGVLHSVMNFSNTSRLCYHDRLVMFRASLSTYLYAVLNGATYFPVDLQRMQPTRVVDWIRQEDITVLRAAVSAFRIITAALSDDEVFPHLRMICLFGEVTYEKDVKLYRRHFSDQCLLASVLGTSEFGDFAYFFLDKATQILGGAVPGGYPIETAKIILLDKANRPVVRGEVGEIAVQSRYGADGYWRQPDLTNTKFIVDIDDNTRTFKTGDLGRIGADGCIYHLGRKDFQVKIRGYRVEVLEIETTLLECKTIKQAVVCGREDTPGNTQLVAYLISTKKNKPSVSYLRRFLSEKLPNYMIPSFFVWLDTFPLTPTGKVDRRAFPAPGNERPELETNFAPPRTHVEDKLTEIWAEVLNIEPIGIHDDFFELGGHSLLTVQINSRIRDLFQIELPLHRFFKDSTVAGLVKFIEANLYNSSDLQTYPIHAANRDQEIPLSFAQQRLWFLDKLEPNSSLYNVIRAIKLNGPLDVEALQKSLNKIVSRHETLRTTFIFVKDKVVQAIAEPSSVDLSVIDLRNFSEFDRESEAKRVCQKEAQRPFDLSSDLMIQATLFQIDNDEHILLLVLHHIATDEWSMSILFRELSISYEAFSRAESPVLPDLPIQYADFAVWQHQWLKDKVIEKQLEYWKRQLKGATFVLELPTDRPRPAVQSFRGTKQSIELSYSISDALRSLCQTERATMFMTLIAAFNVLLHRYTGRNDILVGSPIANRSRIEIEGLIGFFLNTIVIRTDLSGDPSFRKLLAQVRKVCVDAYVNQDLPFEKMVAELQPDRDLSHSPLFNVMFVLQNDSELNLQLSGLYIKHIELDSETAKFDLFFFVIEKANGFSCILEYNTDLFKEATIKRMLEHFKILVNGIITNPDTPISQLPLLTHQEQHQLLVDWNDTQKDYPKDLCIQELFEAQVEESSDCISVVFGEEALTYRELNRRANQLAHYLQRLGVGPDVLVGICVKRSIEMMVALLGVFKAGGAYVPLDPSFPTERLALVLEDAQVAVLLTQKDLTSILPENHGTAIYLDKDLESLVSQQPEGNPSSEVNAEHLAYVIYTSGSTGRPKGVQISHRALVNFLFSMMKEPGLTDQDVLLAVTTLSFDIAMLELLLPLIVGARVVIVSSEEASDGNRLLNRLTDCSATVMQATPASWRLLLAAGWQGDDHLKILCGGEALPRDLATQLLQRGHSLWNMYGPTETTIWSTVNKLKDKEGPVLIGFPIANTQIYILDQHLQPVPVGVPGELHIGGDGLARGYLNRPELTAERFIANPFNDMPGSRLYKTGDLAKYLPDGNIEVLGRLDFQVKVRGFRIELGDIETTLEQHPAVRQAVVIAREDIPGDKQLVAYIVSNDHQTIPVNALRSFLHKKLPSYMVPSLFEMIDALPLTPNGKIDRRALPAPDRIRREKSETLIAPRDELELQLTKTWEKVLGVQPIGVSDNFFELGGHSLIAVRLIMQIEKMLGKNLPLATLFQAPTVEQLAGILREQDWSAPLISLEAIEIDGAGSKGIMRMQRKIADHIPAKSHVHLKQLYHKIKQHPRYRYLKRQYFRAKSSIIRQFLSYSPGQLEEKLRKIGLTEGDSVYMHSAFNAFNGFLGGPQQIINCILNVIGESGNLLMVSMAYTGTTDDYLKAVKTFDVIKTESSMGIITEIFRRRKDVVRSLNPAHPILAFGPDAKWIISDHDKTKYSCGKGSPFEKILELNAKAFFFDVSFRAMTFFHYLEDRFNDTSPVQLYDDEPLESRVIDSNGNEMRVKTYVFSKEARENRSVQLIERGLKNRNLMKTDSIGNTKLTLVNLKNVVGVAQQLVNAGMHFYKA